MIKNKALKRVSKADRKHLRQAMEKAFKRISAQNKKDNEQARKALAKQGIQFVRPAETDMPSWRRAVSDAVNEMGRQGVFSKKLLGRVRADLKAFRSR